MLICFVARLKRCKLFRNSVYTYLVKSLANVKLYKDLGVSDSGERFIN
jgi:hypothetical protein